MDASPGDSALLALSSPTRIRLVEQLSAGPLRAGELARRLDLPAPVVSKHLRALLQAGVVADERGETDARVRMFALRPESVVALQAWLDQIQALWHDQLHAFRRHVERRER